ncbi:MAG: hypothetical protein U0R24_04230 [Solirubrobacterales bacterium]
MADLSSMRDEFAAAFEAGESPNPADWLQRVDGEERQELEGLIDHYLMTAPRRAWDAKAYETSLTKIAIDRVIESRDGVSGTWPELLPRLRNQTKLKRSALIEQLAKAIGVGTAPPTVEKVGVYYNGMEHGTLAARGVSQRVLDALAGLVGTTGELLRSAGGSEPPPEPGAPAFARMAAPDLTYRAHQADRADGADAAAGEIADMEALADAAEPSGRDLVDELFTGG